jgi:hypothetical protein
MRPEESQFTARGACQRGGAYRMISGSDGIDEAKTDPEITKLEVAIERVEAEIITVEATLSSAADPLEKQYLRDKERQLRDKESQLRDEKKQIRNEKLVVARTQTVHNYDGMARNFESIQVLPIFNLLYVPRTRILSHNLNSSPYCDD